MNDTFLSDWKGVIGEELKLQKNLELEIGRLSEELDRQKQKLEDKGQKVSVESQIKELEKVIEEKLEKLPFATNPINKRKKGSYEVDCPYCEKTQTITLRRKVNAIRHLECESCNQFFQAKFIDDENIDIFEGDLVPFEVSCPICKNEIHNEIPRQPGITRRIKCDNCEFDFRVAKSKTGVNVISRGYYKNLPEKVVDEIKNRIPPKPWEKGIHIKIAEELGVSNSLVSYVFKMLASEEKTTPNSAHDDHIA